jgi:hypothetical protein
MKVCATSSIEPDLGMVNGWMSSFHARSSIKWLDSAWFNSYSQGTNGPWTPVHPLGEALHILRMSRAFCRRSEFTAPGALAPAAIKLRGNEGMRLSP